ncbi:hypothetical protein [Geomicrobium sp. JCM 19039]|uniref:hypothetical protein n=1 Tax=Geomicrobium sp. JCM 19039 TaxID=1460636 RepID=UPI00045F499B|nr:hypothetical protein [Geomicrobium sp. JCM 19039]GAK12685.1 hypothetical protein JCM19039_2478 [Geomicrobium sp. JCM 19039]
MIYQNGIFADPATFGELRFVGHQRNRYKFDRLRQQRTDILESRVYKLVYFASQKFRRLQGKSESVTWLERAA